MKSDMGWDYALLGYRRKKTLTSYQGHFKVKLSKIIEKNVFLISYRIPELISRLHHFFQKVRQNT